MRRARILHALILVFAAGCDDGGIAFIGAQIDLAHDASLSRPDVPDAASVPAAGDGGNASDAAPGCASSCSGTAAACGLDYCQSLPQLGAPPVLDGVVDCALPLASIDAAHWLSPFPAPADLRTEYAAAWRPDGLYVFVHVIEAQRLPSIPPNAIFCGDACHVFVDSDGRFDAPPAYDAAGTRQLIAAAPPDGVSAISTGAIYTPSTGPAAWDGSHFRAFPVSDGYVLEGFVVASDLGLATWTLGASQRVGFDLAVSYGGAPGEYTDPACHKRGDFYLQAAHPDAGAVVLPHANTTAFCTPVLAAPGP